MSVSEQVAGRSRFYYGWVILVVSSAIIFVNSGIRSGFGVFLKPMANDMGWSRAQVSMAISISMIVYGLSQPLMGRLVDRHGPRVVVSAGILITVIGVAPLAFINSLWQFYLIYGIIGALGFGGSGTVPLTPTVTAWFVRRRATALSIIGAGAALGQSIFMPFAAFLLVFMSWRQLFLVLAAMVLIGLLPMVGLLLRGKPTEEEALQYKELAEPASSPSAKFVPRSVPAVPALIAMRSGRFILVSTGFFSCGVTSSLVFTHLFAHGTDIGLPDLVSANAMSIIGIVAIIATLACGALADRTGARRPLAFIYLLRGVAMVMLVMSGNNIPMFYASAFVFGISWAATGSLTSALIADFFGYSSLGTLFGTVMLVHQVGSALGAYLGGLSYDLYGSYTWAFLGASIVAFIGALAVYRMPDPELVPAT